MINDKIKSYRDSIQKSLIDELKPFSYGSSIESAYDEWYRQLSPARRELLNIISRNPMIWHWQYPYTLNKHRIDHHIYGYIAPMEIYRKGYGNNILTPSEQLSQLSAFFKDHGIRFIYAALPCKKALYPEIIFSNWQMESIPVIRHGIIPQWRKMVCDLINAGVEVIDLYHELQPLKSDNMLFGYSHNINYTGAKTIGKIIADYLLLTTESGIFKNDKYDFIAEPAQIDAEGQLNKIEQIFIRPEGFKEYNKYMGSQLRSELGIFGNCNLQNFLDTGFDITAHIAKNINCPVNYIGRILPFDPGNTMEIAGLRDHVFADKKIVIYLGFPSAAYVRSVSIGGSWSQNLPPERLF